jgi:hypothetical protein
MPSDGEPEWKVTFTPEAESWYQGLNAKDTIRINAAINRVKRIGPDLGRPSVDRIKRSQHHNMKEMRSSGGYLRALFVFGPNRQAVVLVGGDKTNDWKGWYKRNVPLADRLYDRHLQGLGKEGPCLTRTAGAGRQSGVRSR